MMAGEGAKLATGWLELSVSTKGAQKSMTEELMPAARSAGGGAGTSLGEALLGGVKKFAGPAIALFAGFSVAKFASDSIGVFNDLASSINGLQRIAGGTKEEVSGLFGALKLSGVDADKANASLTIFSKTLGNAAGDSEKTAELTAKMGTSFLDAAGNVKPMAEIMPGLSDTFKSMPDGAEKTALATSLFGRSGAALLPFLNKGSAGMAELTAKAASMGLVIDDVSAKSFANAKVSAREFSSSIEGLKVTLGGNLLPIVTSVQNVFRQAFLPIILAITGALQNNRDTFLSVAVGIQGFADKVGTAMTAVMAVVGPALGAIFKSFGDVGNQLGAAVGPAFAALGPVFTSLVPQLVELWSTISPVGLAFQALTPVLPTLINLVGSLATSLAGALGTALSAILPAVIGLAQSLAGILVSGVQTLMPIVVTLVELLSGSLSTALTTILPIIASLASSLAGALGAALTSLAPVVTNLVGLLGGVLGDAITALLPVVLSIVEMMSGNLSSAITALIPVITQIVEVLGGALGTALTALMPSITQIVGLLGGVFSSVIAALLPIITSLIPVFAQIASTLGGVLGTVIQALIPIITLVADVFAQLLPVISPLIGLVFQLITPILGLITPLLSLITPILGLISPLLQLVGAILTPLIQLFSALLAPILGLITPLVGLLMPAIQIVVNVLSFLITIIVSVLTWITELVTGTGDAGTQLADLWNSTMGMFSDFFTNTGGMFSDFFTNTIGMIADFGANVGRGFMILWNGAQKIFTDGINTVVSFMQGLPGSLLNALGDLGSLFIDSGRSLIQGFIDGITGMISNIGDALGGVMDFVGSFFPHSPAERGPLSGSGWTAIKTAGLAVGEQFGDGLKSMEPAINAQMNALMTAPELTSTSSNFSIAPGTAASRASDPQPVFQIYEAVSAVATAMQVNRIQYSRGI